MKRGAVANLPIEGAGPTHAVAASAGPGQGGGAAVVQTGCGLVEIAAGLVGVDAELGDGQLAGEPGRVEVPGALDLLEDEEDDGLDALHEPGGVRGELGEPLEHADARLVGEVHGEAPGEQREAEPLDRAEGGGPIDPGSPIVALGLGEGVADLGVEASLGRRVERLDALLALAHVRRRRVEIGRAHV